VLLSKSPKLTKGMNPLSQPQAPLGFAPLEGEDATEDGKVIGVSAEEQEQLQLWALRIKNRNL
jgi:hypothetical protein